MLFNVQHASVSHLYKVNKEKDLTGDLGTATTRPQNGLDGTETFLEDKKLQLVEIRE